MAVQLPHHRHVVPAPHQCQVPCWFRAVPTEQMAVTKKWPRNFWPDIYLWKYNCVLIPFNVWFQTCTIEVRRPHCLRRWRHTRNSLKWGGAKIIPWRSRNKCEHNTEYMLGWKAMAKPRCNCIRFICWAMETVVFFKRRICQSEYIPSTVVPLLWLTPDQATRKKERKELEKHRNRQCWRTVCKELSTRPKAKKKKKPWIWIDPQQKTNAPKQCKSVLLFHRWCHRFTMITIPLFCPCCPSRHPPRYRYCRAQWNL